jgi:hypothetical protein
LRLQYTRVVRTCDGRYDAVVEEVLASPEGAKRDRERVYIDETNAWGASVRRWRMESGSRLDEAGGDEYSVDSKVMRRMSHFLRSSERASGTHWGGLRMAKAEWRRETVVSTSRRTKARAARVYSERRVALWGDARSAVWDRGMEETLAFSRVMCPAYIRYAVSHLLI